MASLRLLTAACLTGHCASSRSEGKPPFTLVSSHFSPVVTAPHAPWPPFGAVVPPPHSPLPPSRVGASWLLGLEADSASRVFTQSVYSPGFLAAVEEAAESPAVMRILDVLNGAEGAGDGRVPHVRGIQVKTPNLVTMYALYKNTGWILFEFRPSPELQQKKVNSVTEIKKKYLQPLGQSGVSMKDFVLDTVFDLPMVAVDPAKCPQYETPNGEEVKLDWQTVDWEEVEERARQGHHPPDVVLAPNCFPYCMPTRDGDTEVQRTGQHHVLWYYNNAEDALPNPSDEEIERDVRAQVQALADEKGYAAVDYIWYRNPHMSVPDVFHVQVFLIVRNGGDHGAKGHCGGEVVGTRHGDTIALI